MKRLIRFKFTRTLARNWWMGCSREWGCGKRGSGMEEAGGEKEEKKLLFWMEVVENE